MTLNDVAEIKACRNVYRAADVARHYGINPSTVTKIWEGQRRAGIKPAAEPPNINTKPRMKDLAEDIVILLKRGHTAKEVANTVGLSERSVYRAVAA